MSSLQVFAATDTNAAACANACTALELLVFLLSVLRREQILAALKPLQRGLAACVSSSNAKIVRLTHNLLAKLTALFPTEPTGTAQASKVCVGTDKLGQVFLLSVLTRGQILAALRLCALRMTSWLN